jgi:hypothetical protein
MPSNLWPNWMKSALDGRFLDLTKEASDIDEIDSITHQLHQLTAELKEQLTPDQVKLLLRWEEIINYRCTVEKEWLYFTGVQDGLSLWKHLLNTTP